jgi:transposase-like protein
MVSRKRGPKAQEPKPRPPVDYARLPPENRLQVREALRRNESPTEVAARHGVNLRSLRRPVKEARESCQRRDLPHDRLDIPYATERAQVPHAKGDSDPPGAPERRNLRILKPNDTPPERDERPDDDETDGTIPMSALPVPWVLDSLIIPTRQQLIDLGKRKAFETANQIQDPREFSDWAKGMALVVSMDRMESELAAADEMRPDRAEDTAIALRTRFDQLADKLGATQMDIPEAAVFREEDGDG